MRSTELVAFRFCWLCIGFGLITLVLAIIGAVLMPKTCGEDRGLGPVLALELAITEQQVDALVNSPQCIADLRENTIGDMAAFIPSFTAFLVCGALSVGRRRKAALAAVPIFLLAGLSDQVEDVAMLQLLGGFTAPWFTALFIAARLKFLLLSVGVLVARAERVAGAVMVVGGALALTGLVADARLLMPGTLIAWLALFVSSVRSVRAA